MGYIEEPVHEYEIPGLAEQAVRDAMANFAQDFAADDLEWQLAGLDAAAKWIEAEKGRLIANMRTAGHSWTEIGSALGVSKQAAAKKYGSQLEV